MTNATHHYNHQTHCIHCRGQCASEDHHLSLTIPPLPTLPACPTPHQRNPTPGPSTTTQGHSGALTTATRSQCNRCINGQQCDAAEDTRNRYDGFDDDCRESKYAQSWCK